MYKVLGVSIIHILMYFGIYFCLILIIDITTTLVRDNEVRDSFSFNLRN